ncbi:type IX secretion system membrane protein, PorP/SprF family [Capnocytophaga haemolytica]|nr:PorP/SprF family type IX secretion system membrane protein [Capnocytophaga haemolytica]SFN90202.1 type IX secretion system membrane protein, PorP/SprF family [Capnocytophaga haemolytica]SNV16501.1 Bacteroidetes-specific putative membrane protein [Capnocytophaga haemolytica]
MNKIYILLSAVLFCAYSHIMQAQNMNYVDYIFYTETQNLINPAAVGGEKGHTIMLNLRNQWLQSYDSDAPQVQSLITTYRLTKRIGLGVSVVNNKVFIQRETAFLADFSYSIPLNETSEIYLGLKAGGNLFNLDGSRIKTYNEKGQYDPLLNGYSGRFQPNVGAGVYYKTDRFYVGLSAPNLLASDVVKKKDGIVTSVAEQMYFYALGGYYLPITQDITLCPSMQAYLAKDTHYQVCATAAALYRDFLEVGIGYRTETVMNGYAMFKAPDWHLSVGYGFETNEIPT